MLALRLGSGGRYSRGLYHEKAGIFTDSTGHHVTFAGSSNETRVDCWKISRVLKRFAHGKIPKVAWRTEMITSKALWNNSTSGLQ
jgi:hypothetical protein